MNNIGILKLALSHHPVCYFYRNHVFRLPGRLGAYPLCLGCSAFYPTLLIVALAMFSGTWKADWETMVVVSVFLMAPTILRLFIPLSSSRKKFRFLIKAFLGGGVGIGIFSLTVAPNAGVFAFQILFGVILYLGIFWQRKGNPYPECSPCTYNPSKACPGLAPFYGRETIFGEKG